MISYMAVLSVAATLAALCMLGAPIFTVSVMRHTHTVGVLTITFFCAQFLNCSVWIMYGVQVRAWPVVICNAMGCAVAAYCIVTFLSIARQQEKAGHAPVSTSHHIAVCTTLFTCGLVAFVLMALLCMQAYGIPQVAIQSSGILAGCCVIFMLSSPLGMVPEIIKRKNAEALQPLIVGFGTLNGVLWTVYGGLLGDLYIAVPNGICTLACLLQVFLLFFYGRHPTAYMETTEFLAPQEPEI